MTVATVAKVIGPCKRAPRSRICHVSLQVIRSFRSLIRRYLVLGDKCVTRISSFVIQRVPTQS
jgi:hypothetical protein